MKKINIYLVVSAILIVINAVAYALAKENTLMYFSDFMPLVCSALALIGIFSAFNGFKTYDFTKITWLAIGVGMVFSFIAEGIYGFLEVILKFDMAETFPSLADLFWCAGYLALAISLIMMLIGYKKSGFPMNSVRKNIVLSLITVLLGVVVVYFLLIPIINDDETNFISKVVYLFYPVWDLILVSMSLILLTIINQFGKGLISIPWKFLALGFVCFTVSDLLYSYLDWQDAYGNGNYIDLGWNMGYLFFGLSGLYQRYLTDSILKR